MYVFRRYAKYQGGMFAWADMFWSGCKVGLGVGGAFGIAYYLRG